ncbi:putative O-methyltransferase [Aspergillus ambiguus]|uniref:putative O-methyltransferase n=1 Tax=Aspergillus ambiguus TaxID=176160 RepID=UPI003CCCBDF0
MASPSVSPILNSLAAAGQDYENNKPGSRESLIKLSRMLISELDIPSEFIQQRLWAEMILSGILRLSVDIKLLPLLKEAGDAGLTLPALAEKTGMDVAILQRLARHLVTMNVIQYQNGAFHATRLSNGLAEPRYQDSISYTYDVARPAFAAYPEYFKYHSSEHLDAHSGPFQYGHNTDLPFFEWLVATPPSLQLFDSLMTGYRAGKVNWCERGFYPVSERLVDCFDSSVSDVFLVDIGGGVGHDLRILATQHAHLPGKLVLQDRDAVIAKVTPEDRECFEAQVHDFFTPQPVMHARAYYLHSILHDWRDDDAVRILKNLAPALKPGYSRVLLNEIVVDEEAPALPATIMDMMMLSHLAAKERTEGDWRAVLEDAGLNIVNVYKYPGVAESVIEAELA